MRTFLWMFRLFVALQLVAPWLPAFAATVIEQPRLGYTVTLPDGWEQMPKQVIDEQMRALAAVANGQVMQHYDDAFQRSADGAWFRYPYVLVQAHEKGRMREAELKQMKDFRKGFQKGAAETEEKMSAVVSDMNLGETFYDSSNKCIFVRYSMNVSGIGEVKAVTRGFLTEKGMIAFNCYARGADFDEQLPVFETLLNSVQISEELRYRSRPGFEFGYQMGRIAGIAVPFGAVVGLVALVIVLVKKQQKKNRYRPPPIP